MGNAVSSFVVCSLTSKFKVHLLWGGGSGWAYALLPQNCFAFSFLLHTFFLSFMTDMLHLLQTCSVWVHANVCDI